MFDCSIASSADFVKYLNEKQQSKYKARMAYVSGRYNYLNKDYKSAATYLSNSVKSASLRIRFRSVFMLVLICIYKVLRILKWFGWGFYLNDFFYRFFYKYNLF